MKRMETNNKMNATIQILSVKTEEGLRQIAGLASSIWAEAYAEILTKEQIDYMLKMMYDLPVLKHEMEEEDMQFRLICDGDVPVGFFAYAPYPGKPGAVKLHKLYLDSTYHGRGIGSLALRYVSDACREAGYKTLYLNVNKQNARALKAYERNGFVCCEKVVNDIGNGFVMDDFVMKKVLK